MNTPTRLSSSVVATVVLAVSAVLASAQTTHIAYDNPAGFPANQTFGGNVGMDFNVGFSPIKILELGVFDAGQDGFTTPRTVSIWDRDTTSLVTSLTLDAGLSGTLVNGSRFLALPAPLTLSSFGHYTVVLDDVSVDGIRNSGGNLAPFSTVDGGKGAIAFVGGGRFGFGAGTYPGTVDGGPPNRYFAGTFKYEAPPTPDNPLIAYDVPFGLAGAQNFGGSLGMDFDVGGSGLTISQVGVFDSNSDGLSRTITAYIYNRADGTVFAGPYTFSGFDGTLIGGSRFLDVADIDLPAGFQGSIVAEGYGPGELLFNSGGTSGGASVTHDGGGLFAFVGAGRYGVVPGTFPNTVDGGPANRYAAGTFMFVPEPTTAAMLLIGATFAACQRRRKSAV